MVQEKAITLRDQYFPIDQTNYISVFITYDYYRESVSELLKKVIEEKSYITSY